VALRGRGPDDPLLSPFALRPRDSTYDTVARYTLTLLPETSKVILRNSDYLNGG
jgi:hypothetical protein